MKRKLLAFFLTFVLTISMVACGDSKTNVSDNSTENGVKEEHNESDHNHSTETESENTEESTNESTNNDSTTSDSNTGNDSNESDISDSTSDSDNTSNSDSSNESDSSDNEGSSESGDVVVEYEHSHAYATEVVKATCTSDGYTKHTCECGENYTTDTIKATGHSFGGWETKTPATTTSTGLAERKCGACGHTESKVLDKLVEGHTHSYNKKVVSPTCTTEGYTIYTCSCGDSYTADKTSKTAHNYKSVVTEPTCETEGYTTYTCSCGDSYVGNKTAMIPHTYEKKVVWEPTCSKKGWTRYNCTMCKSGYDEYPEMIDHTYEEVKRTGDVCTGYKVEEECSKCATTRYVNLEGEGHKTHTERKEPNCGNIGYVREICDVCKKIVSDETLARVGKHNYTTQTLSTAAAAAYKAGWNEFVKFRDSKSYTVEACTTCKFIKMETATYMYTDVEAATIMLGMVNDLRREVYGTNEYDLVLDLTLLELAKIRAKEICYYYSHDTDTFTNRSAENIAGGADNIYGIFTAWKISDGHYRNMIDIDLKYFAYAAYNIDDGRDPTYARGVQLFWTHEAREAYL